MKKSTIAKKTEGYGYKYTELADINKYCEENGIRYYQEVETCETNQKDYIITYIVKGYIDKKDGYKEVVEKHRGCQIVEARLQGINNPVQAYGSSLTYCRRYSLLMALGLATEDDDGASVGEPTKEEAESYTFKSGKHEGWTLKKVIEEDKKFLNWLLNNSKDARLLKMIEVLTGEVPKTDEEWDERFELTQRLQKMIVEKGLPIDDECDNYGVKNTGEMDTETLGMIVDYYEKLYKVQDIIKDKKLDEKKIVNYYKKDNVEDLAIEELEEIIAKRG